MVRHRASVERDATVAPPGATSTVTARVPVPVGRRQRRGDERGTGVTVLRFDARARRRATGRFRFAARHLGAAHGAHRPALRPARGAGRSLAVRLNVRTIRRPAFRVPGGAGPSRWRFAAGGLGRTAARLRRGAAATSARVGRSLGARLGLLLENIGSRRRAADVHARCLRQAVTRRNGAPRELRFGVSRPSQRERRRAAARPRFSHRCGAQPVQPRHRVDRRTRAARSSSPTAGRVRSALGPLDVPAGERRRALADAILVCLARGSGFR